MYLFFDTETTGIPRNYKAPLTDLENWPRMVQIAWLLTDEAGEEIDSAEFIIQPQGFTIPKDAAEIHGITTEMALRDGVDITQVLATLTPHIDAARVLIAHNMAFDEKILGAEYLRAGLANPLEGKQRSCTMQSATDFCQLPGRYGHKWPTLHELHLKLFNRSFEGAHRALVDVRACVSCYFELKRRKVMA
jgi:DNA polymerase III subunit epsilon